LAKGGLHWTIVRADDKHAARHNAIRDMLSRLHYGDKDKKVARPDPAVVVRYDTTRAKRGLPRETDAPPSTRTVRESGWPTP
jgi:hypothetical protein